MLIKSVTEFGKYRANPYASNTNNLFLNDGCDCEPCTVGQDTIIVSDMGDMPAVSVEFDGVTYYAPVDTITAQQIEDWIYSIIKQFEVDPYLSVTIDCHAPELQAVGDQPSVQIEEVCDLTVVHIGCGHLDTLSFGGETIGSSNRTTEIKTVCDYRISIVDDPGTFTDGTNSDTLDSQPFAYTGVIETDAATAADIVTDIEALFSSWTDVATVDVTVDDINGEYVVSIHSEKDLYSWSMDGVPFVRYSCTDVFVSGD